MGSIPSRPKTLTAAFVRTVSTPGRYGDGRGGHGLSLLVKPTKTGRWSKSWSQRLYIDGKPIMVGLGSYPVVPLADARQRALANRQTVERGKAPPRRRRTHRHRGAGGSDPSAPPDMARRRQVRGAVASLVPGLRGPRDRRQARLGDHQRGRGPGARPALARTRRDHAAQGGGRRDHAGAWAVDGQEVHGHTVPLYSGSWPWSSTGGRVVSLAAVSPSPRRSSKSRSSRARGADLGPSLLPTAMANSGGSSL